MDSIKRNFIPIVAAATVLFVVWHFFADDTAEEAQPVTESSLAQPEAEAHDSNAPFTVTSMPQKPLTSGAPQKPGGKKKAADNNATNPVENPENAEDYLMNLALANDMEAREAMLFEALMLDPYNPLLNFMVIEHCLSNINSSQCGPDIFNALELLDSDNAAVKDLKAVQAYQNGDVDGAMAALKEALEMEVTDDYRWQRMDAISQVLDERGEAKGATFVKKVLRLSATREGLRFEGLNRMCREQQTNGEWRQLCSQRGAAMSKNSLSQNSKYVGYGIAVSLSDDPESKASILKGLSQQSDYIQGLDKQFDAITERNPDWKFSDREWEGYLRVYAEDGEISATSYLLAKLREK